MMYPDEMRGRWNGTSDYDHETQTVGINMTIEGVDLRVRLDRAGARSLAITLAKKLGLTNTEFGVSVEEIRAEVSHNLDKAVADIRKEVSRSVSSLAAQVGREKKRHDLAGKAYTAAEACEKMRISRTTLYAWMKSGAIRTVRVGGRRLVPASELHDILNSNAH